MRVRDWAMGTAAVVAIGLAAPLAAQVRPVPSQPSSASAAAAGVEVYLINDTAEEQIAPAPDGIEVTAANGDHLQLSPRDAAPVRVAPGGFAKLMYDVADRATTVVATAPPATIATAQRSPLGETTYDGSRGTSSGFVERLRPAEPIYAVAGLGHAGAKLQFSVGLAPFVGDELLSHLRLAYTQTFFWAVDRPSGPVRDTNYSPEAFFDLPLDSKTILGLGYRHDSNGEGEATSVNSHRIMARLSHRFDLGDDWQAYVSPSAWFFVGGQGVATDLDRYWGYTGLDASIERRDGIKLALSGRGNPGTGKGSLEGFVSYPVARFGVFGIYLFGEGFTGYGEAITRYNVSDRHLRLGFSVTR